MAKVIGRARDVVGMMKDGSLIPLNLTISEQVMGNQVRYVVKHLLSPCSLGPQSLFTAILRPLSDDAPRSDTKSVMQAEREMLSTLAVAAVMIDERGCIQGFNEVRSSPPTTCLSALTVCRRRRTCGASSCRRWSAAT